MRSRKDQKRTIASPTTVRVGERLPTARPSPAARTATSPGVPREVRRPGSHEPSYEYREHGRELSAASADKALRKALRKKIALAIRRVAMKASQIARLTDNYAAAVMSKEFAAKFNQQTPRRPFLPPKLFDKNGPWAGLGVSDGPVAPRHVGRANGFSRSAFTVYLRLPEGRESAKKYLKRLATFRTPWLADPTARGTPRLIPHPNTPQFPVGTQVALVRRMVLIDSNGRMTPTKITEQVQFRVYRRIESFKRRSPQPAQWFFEFNLIRDRLFAGKTGGLRAVTATERDFFPVPFAVHIDPIENFAKSGRADRGLLTKRMSVTAKSCSSCHRKPGILSVNAYTRDFGPRYLRPPRFFLTASGRAMQMTIQAKQRRYDWGLLTGLSTDR